MSTLSSHDLSLETLDELASVDALALFVAEDERPLKGLAGYVDWRLCGALSRVLKASFFSGKKDDWLLLPSKGRIRAERIFALGVGNSAQLTAAAWGQAMALSARRLSLAQVGSVALEIPGAESLDEPTRVNLFLKHFLPEFRGDKTALLGERSLRRYLSSPVPGRAGA